MNNFIENSELKNITKPARYIGGEVNQVIKTNAKTNVVLCYPNIYEKAMSNHIINLLYTNLNKISHVYAKRCFAPGRDFEKLLQEKSIELFSLEDRVSIKENELLIFVIESELDYTNYINMLTLSNINLNKNERNDNSPKILIISSNEINVKPIENFADYVINGNDMQDNVKELINFVKQYDKTRDLSIDEIEFASEEILDDTSYIIPSIKIENSSIILDLKTVADFSKTIEYVNRSIRERGITKVSFINQDSMDINKFCELVYRLKTNAYDVRILVKNLDFAKFTPDVLNILLPCMEKASLKINGVTCNKSISNMLNINIDKKEILDNVICAFKNGWNSIKLNFNIGLPNETYEDIDDIFNFAEEIVNIYSERKAKEKLSVILNFKLYIPTLNDIKEYNLNNVNKLETKIRYIKEKRIDPVIKVSVDSIDTYNTKILLKNGEEDISKVIIDAYNLGARFDSNNKEYNKQAWEKAIYDNTSIVSKYIN